ncbi:MAG TPA: ABC transporter permease [Kofleriaceae bacterium]|nr:ABC transporter permease [Kofleriaceae bacterium]
MILPPLSRLSPSARLGAAMLALFLVLALVGPWIAPYPVGDRAVNSDLAFLPATWSHWLGTDQNGVDALSQLLYGARAALVLSVMVVALCAAIGVAIGVAAGYFRGVVDVVISRVIDILLAFPGILLNIAIVAIVDRPGLGVLVVALVANGWVGYARVARGQVLSLRERDYVTAARALGAGHVRVMTRHVLPNLLGPVIVQATFSFGAVVVVEASLSFLGLGRHVDYSWGAMLDQGRTFLWKPGFIRYALAPGFAIAWVVLAANLLGDGLRDWLDPRQRGRS